MRLALERLFRVLHRGGLMHQDSSLPTLDYPLAPTPRVAVLGAAFRAETGVYSLPQWTPERLTQLRPLALAGSWAELAKAARMVQRGELALPGLLYPLVVLTPAGDAPLSQREHLQLWDWFGLPAWEQIRGQDGKLLAVECEARNGFHLAPGVDVDHLDGWLDADECDCAQRKPRYRLAAEKALAAAGD
ncbi:MAG: hypothetical protein HY821_11935 [Acidobacteria bacterium]|nr:hypothetical protein [Acidobacteriota bacterium]